MPQDGPPPDTGAGWRGRKVLVTGADGFIGSHLTEALLAAGAEVRAFCFYNSQG
ncbi:MAG: GDP-mannose 4,6-dehydratase, partial [Gemmatimonadota bacterium]|nr:GDP-mannose 4,6-dehydratase [Gemmatimonadota bacterium]